ncbi:hypothetical protein MCEGEM3_01986 [Oxalobacteraceae bacterium]
MIQIPKVRANAAGRRGARQADAAAVGRFQPGRAGQDADTAVRRTAHDDGIRGRVGRLNSEQAGTEHVVNAGHNACPTVSVAVQPDLPASTVQQHVADAGNAKSGASCATAQSDLAATAIQAGRFQKNSDGDRAARGSTNRLQSSTSHRKTFANGQPIPCRIDRATAQPQVAAAGRDR